MQSSKRSLGVLIVFAGLIIGAFGWLVAYVRSGTSEAITFDGITLTNLRKEWLIEGSPKPPPLAKYVRDWTDADRFMVCTTAYTVDSESFHSLFAMSDTKFENKGILVISEDGKLLWVDNVRGPRLVNAKPE